MVSSALLPPSSLDRLKIACAQSSISLSAIVM
jgi:hypothetical protein